MTMRLDKNNRAEEKGDYSWETGNDLVKGLNPNLDNFKCPVYSYVCPNCHAMLVNAMVDGCPRDNMFRCLKCDQVWLIEQIRPMSYISENNGSA